MTADGVAERAEDLDYVDAPDAAVCEHCGAPFADEELLALHLGHEHPDALTDDQREAFEDAYANEQAEIRRFRLKALGVLVLLYFLFLMVYAVV
ncbi:C2H2-type zinc finger protein [Salinibaculum salinum]|uniref:C2H2-type zinc finger protein n=1 Tax=Salinibaculum salinum TaxID=3131996 RepID=UPI0030EB8B61